MGNKTLADFKFKQMRHDYKVTPLPSNCQVGKEWGSGMGPKASIDNYSCPRCGGNEMLVLSKVNDKALFSCASDQCLSVEHELLIKNLAKESKEIEKKSALRNKERMFDTFGDMYSKACLSDSYLSAQRLNSVKLWIDSGKYFFVFSGISGCGKTYTSAAIFSWLLDKNKEVDYLKCKHFTAELRATMAAYTTKTDDEVVRKYQRKDYLILDDVGSTQNTGYQIEKILDLIDYRYEYELPTMITTNLSYQALKDVMGDRLASRVYNKNSLIIEDNETDHRMN